VLRRGLVVAIAFALCALGTAAAPAAARAAGSAAGPAIFKVGAASVTIDPTYPVYMGGYGGGPAGGTVQRHTNPLTGKAEDFTVRAMSIESGGHVVQLARVDTQGWFAGYVENDSSPAAAGSAAVNAALGVSDVRQRVATYLQAHGHPGASSSDIIIGSLHEHAAPTLNGLWGPAPQQLPYLEQVAAGAIQALEQAYAAERPATLTWGRVDAPWLTTTTIANGNANEGWYVDGALFALWARDATNTASRGSTIATWIIQPGYPNIVPGPGDIFCPSGVDVKVLSTDFPAYTQSMVEQRLGGVAMVASGTLGRQPGPMQGDGVRSPDLPPQQVTYNGKTYSCAQTIAFDDAIHMGIAETNLVAEALADGLKKGHVLTDPTVASAEQYVLTPITNPIVLALLMSPVANYGVWNNTPLNQLDSALDRDVTPPYLVGNNVGTWVTGLRIGDLAIISEPGEFFPDVHAAWDQGIKAADVEVVGIGQDQLGYEYPAYAYPNALWSADEQIFNPSATLGDQVVTAGEQDAQALGFNVDFTANGETQATRNDYTQIVKPGVQFLAFPHSGDISAATGAFTPLLEPFSGAARFGTFTACNPPVCPPGPQFQQPTMGAYSWNFADGTTGTSPAGNETYFSHAFRHPGTYNVTVNTSDSNGTAVTSSLPITVYPSLSAGIRVLGNHLVALARGGTGQVIYYHWTLPGGQSSYQPTVSAASPGVYTLAIVDGTGTVATASLRIAPGPSPAGTTTSAAPPNAVTTKASVPLAAAPRRLAAAPARAVARPWWPGVPLQLAAIGGALALLARYIRRRPPSTTTSSPVM